MKILNNNNSNDNNENENKRIHRVTNKESY